MSLPRTTPTARALGAFRKALIAEGFANHEALEIVLTVMRTGYALCVEIEEGEK